MPGPSFKTYHPVCWDEEQRADYAEPVYSSELTPDVPRELAPSITIRAAAAGTIASGTLCSHCFLPIDHERCLTCGAPRNHSIGSGEDYAENAILQDLCFDCNCARNPERYGRGRCKPQSFTDQNGQTVHDGGVYGVDEQGSLYEIEPIVPHRPSDY
jgi:hypothetical protein